MHVSESSAAFGFCDVWHRRNRGQLSRCYCTVGERCHHTLGAVHREERLLGLGGSKALHVDEGLFDACWRLVCL